MKNKKTVVTFLFTVIFGIIFTILLISILAIIMTKYDLNNSVINASVITICLIACMLSSFICAKYCRTKGIVSGSLIAGILTVIFFISIMSINKFDVIPIIYITIPLNILAGAAGGILSSNLR